MIQFLHQNKHTLFFLIISFCLVMITAQTDSLNNSSLPLQIVSILTVGFWIIYHFKPKNFDKNHSISIIWVFIFLAILIRLYALTIFPLDLQTGFEEIQTGSIAVSILTTKALPIEFRFTNLIAAFGFLMNGTPNLFTLRLGFRIFGLISLILLGLYFQEKKSHWFAALVMIFFAASHKFFVLSGSIADELFAGGPFLLLFLFCFLKLEKTDNPVFWSALAGFFAGILFFEYLSFRIPVFVMVLWLIFFYQNNLKGKERFQTLFSFFLCLIIIATPTLQQSMNHPESSILFDGIRRHFSERETFLSSAIFVNLQGTFFAVFGFPANISAFYTPVRVPMITPYFGWLFIISTLFNLIFDRNWFQKFLAISVLTTLLSISLFSNNNNIGRTVPALILLLIISGNFLSASIKLMQTWVKSFSKKLTHLPSNLKIAQIVFHSTSLFLAGLVVLAFLLFWITQTNLKDLKTMAQDPFVLQEYVNDEFALCSFLGETRQMDQKVMYFSSSNNISCPNTFPEIWYFETQPFVIDGYPLSDLESSDFHPGDLVFIGDKNKQLESVDFYKLVHIGLQSGSLQSLKTKTDLSGKMIAASICYRCK